jgi:hypothetical protein
VGSVEASMLVTRYFAPQVGQWNITDLCMDAIWALTVTASNKTLQKNKNVNEAAWKGERNELKPAVT